MSSHAIEMIVPCLSIAVTSLLSITRFATLSNTFPGLDSKILLHL